MRKKRLLILKRLFGFQKNFRIVILFQFHSCLLKQRREDPFPPPGRKHTCRNLSRLPVIRINHQKPDDLRTFLRQIENLHLRISLKLRAKINLIIQMIPRITKPDKRPDPLLLFRRKHRISRIIHTKPPFQISVKLHIPYIIPQISHTQKQHCTNVLKLDRIQLYI